MTTGSPTPATIVIERAASDEERDRIREAAGDASVEFLDDASQRPELLARATAFAGSVKPGELAHAPHLAWVHSWAAGIDGQLTPELTRSPVVLTSSAGNGAIPLAEHAMMLMLMLNRDAPRWLRAQAERRWDRHQHGELAGLTCGILGLGHSGQDLAIKAKAFHMRVVGLRRRPELDVAAVDHIYPPDQLHDFLAESDFVVVTVPFTPATENLLGAAEFAAMKETASYICYSRGGIANDDDLLKALQEGTIAGAGLDAHGVEPLPSESPFWDLPNVIITPHNGATTAATAARGLDIFIDNLRRFVAGRELVNIVDKQAGY